MKKSILIWLIIVVSLAVIIVISSISLAIWTQKDHDLALIHTPIVDENPSLKYQIFVPVVDSGQVTSETTSAYSRMPGALSFSQGSYEYTLSTGSTASITGFALVGWYGGIAYDVLNVPEQATVVVNGEEITKPVVRLMADAEFLDYNFSGENTIISDITVGNRVIEVDEGFFNGMPYLEHVTFTGQDLEDNEVRYLYLRRFCLGNCPKLNVVDNNRSTPEGWNTAFVMLGSGTQQ